MAGDITGEVAHALRPTGADLPCEGLRLASQLLEIAMFETYSRSTLGERFKENFDFHEHAGIELELVIELPAEQQAMRGLPRKDLAPLRLRSVGVSLEPTAALPRLNDQLGVWLVGGRLAARPPRTHVLSKKLECTGWRRFDVDTAFDRRDAHRDFSFSCSLSAYF